MQRIRLLFAYFVIPIAIGSVNCFSQQYPFVHYTPKDGLISNSIRGIYQDGKGRLYFNSINGLSVYDGARFINYSSKNGLGNDIVNCVMEMGDDSVWIVTNAGRIHCLVNGKLKSMVFKEPPPLIDNLIRDEKGTLYAASEFGLYLFRQNKFIKLPLIDISGKNINTHISNIYPAGKHLLVVRENSLLNSDETHIMYLYDVEEGKIVAQTQNEKIFYVAKAPDGRIWLSTIKNILSVDTIELKKGKIVLRELDPPFDRIEKTSIAFISFDQYGNCWMSDKVFVLKKLSPNGSLISFSTASGLSSMDISNVFQDKEGTTWIATFKAGVNKLVHNNFTFFSNAFGISAINSIVYAADKNQLYLYSPNQGKAIAIGNDNRIQRFEVDKANKFLQLHVTPKGMFGFSENNFFKITRSGNKLYSKPFYVDTIENAPGNPLIDRNGNLVFWGKNFITAIIDGKTIYLKKNNYAVDHAALDTFGNIWITTRNAELIMYQAQADDPSRYLEKEIIVSKKIFDNSPRSIIIDRNNNIWIGSRGDGIHVFKLDNGNPLRQFHLTTEMGLSDHFITWLDVDMDNNIWSCSPSGLDKISIKNGVPVIENITKQNNIYQSATKVVIDKNNTVWALLSNGLIKITPENKQFTGFSPTLMVSMIKSGKDTITEKAATALSHKQNNLSFYFAAASFLDEKQIQYSYKLEGSGNDQWSDPSNNSTISFIDLHPGDYTLHVKANFPAGRYPDQVIQNRFSILPPWWQTWWFQSFAGLLIIGLLIIGIRFYYGRKLEKQKAILEKQQAIEIERTRIATDMHDDLGAGLTRIKFITESFLEKTNDPALKPEAEKLKTSSNELVDKMGEIIWAMNDKNNTLEDLIFYLRSYSVDYCNENKLACEFFISESIPQKIIGGQIRRNVFLVLKESLHNVVKHASAKKIFIYFHVHDKLSLTITDDGKGFEQTINNSGNGLLNMHRRAEALHGKLSISNGAGTTIHLEVPV